MRHSRKISVGIAVAFVLLLPLHTIAAAAKCCAKNGGVNFCDARTGHDICKDGALSTGSSCSCTFTTAESDVCSIPAFYNLYEKKRASGEDVTNLSKKTWWTQCAPWDRTAVYKLVQKRGVQKYKK